MTTVTTGNISTIRLTRAGQGLRAAAALVACAAVAAQLSGCARGVATTAVKPDGSWTRTVTFHGSKPAKDGMDFGATVGDAFTLPTGAGWKITHADTKDEVVVVAERTLAPGEILRGDITTKAAKKSSSASVAANTPPPKPVAVCTNEVTVHQTAPGVYEYRETFHWTGPRSKEGPINAEMVADFKKALPPSLATDANARELATASIQDLWRVFFGPGDPLVSEVSAFMSEPELVERRVQRRVGADLEKRIEVKFGAQTTPEQRRQIAANIIHGAIFQVSNQTKSSASGGEKSSADDVSPNASLFVSVHLPGRIVATNGERDDVTGEVYWGLYPEAALPGDVTLTATCDINK